jgi:hypothetical protein
MSTESGGRDNRLGECDNCEHSLCDEQTLSFVLPTRHEINKHNSDNLSLSLLLLPRTRSSLTDTSAAVRACQFTRLYPRHCVAKYMQGLFW